MAHVISGLLRDYEVGRMNRRQLIALAVDHISYQGADCAKTRDFYVDLLGMTVSDDDGQRQCSLAVARHGRRERAEELRELSRERSRRLQPADQRRDQGEIKPGDRLWKG